MSNDARKVTVDELENILKNTYKLNKDEIKDDIERLKQGYTLGYNGKHFILGKPTLSEENEKEIPSAKKGKRKKKNESL